MMITWFYFILVVAWFTIRRNTYGYSIVVTPKDKAKNIIVKDRIQQRNGLSSCSGLTFLSYSFTSAVEDYLVDPIPFSCSSSRVISLQRQVKWHTIEQYNPSNCSTEETGLNRITNFNEIDEFPNGYNTINNRIQQRMPLYPLPTVIVPDITNTNVTLWNVERRNIRMILDLDKNSSQRNAEKLFCAVLQAKDSGRIASVGTILRVLNTKKEMKYDNHGNYLPDDGDTSTNYRRIVVTCVPVSIVDIVQIVNPIASVKEYRFRNPDEYLVAIVQNRSDVDDTVSASTKGDEQLMLLLSRQIRNDFHRVMSFYLHENVATFNWPISMIKKMQSMEIDIHELSTEDDYVLTNLNFWSSVLAWQSLCETVRTAHETMFISNRNEYMVNTMIQYKRGPLQLPIHVEDLLPVDRQYINKMELAAHQQWLNMRLDPCIDFQVLLSVENDCERYEYFSQMIARERQRLEILIESSHIAAPNPYDNDTASNTESISDDIDASLRKGAWFNDAYW